MSILSKKSCEIIQEELGISLHELASRPLNDAKGAKKKLLLYPERTRGSVRAMSGKLLMPETIEKERKRVAAFRLTKKSTGIYRFLRHFR